MQYFIRVKFRRLLAVAGTVGSITRPVLGATAYYQRTIVSRYILLSSFWPSMPIFSMLSMDLNEHQFYNEMYHQSQRYEIKAYDNRNTMVKKPRLDTPKVSK